MKKERIMAILMLVIFAFAWVAIILGLIRNNETLTISGFVVFVMVALYAGFAKKRIDSEREQECAKQEGKDKEDAENEE